MSIAILIELHLLGFLHFISFLEPINKVAPGQNLLKPVLSGEPIGIRSETELLHASLSNHTLLTNQLDEAGFWNRFTFFNQALDGRIIDQQSLVIIVTDHQNPADRYQVIYQNTDGSVYQGEGLGVRDGQLSLILYLGPEVIQANDPDKLTQRVNVMLLRSIYSLAYSNSSGSNEMETIIKQKIAEFLATGEQIIELTK